MHSDHCPLSFQLSTDEGSMYQITQLRAQSGELFDEIVERLDNLGEEIQPLTKALDEQLFFGQTTEEQLIESYSSAEFLNQLHSLETNLNERPTGESIYIFTELLQTTLKKTSKRKR